ncbi:kinase [Thraustotheca clavata]|uniref:Kinase n=1 Tax=Thraustotheca clavata TaxID=74557 RepID=A0A1V9YT41_9STRA|nr:kinase [Thraustotheca clavata]
MGRLMVAMAMVMADNNQSKDISYYPLEGTITNTSLIEHINQTTFTTRCESCNLSSFRKPTWRVNVDDSTCIWHPDGTCTIGVNLNENDIPTSDWPGLSNGDKRSTQFMMGTGKEIKYVEGLSSVISYITLFRLGIETLSRDLTSNKRSPPYDRGVEATQLNFSDNHIKNIDRIATSDQLFNLFVDRNWIENVGDISTMKELRILNLNANRIKSINNTIWPSKLDTLYLDSNQITYLPTSIGSNLRRLTTLSLQNNSISSIDGIYFGDNLNSLYLANNALSQLNGAGLPSGLDTLHLQYNKLKWVNASLLPTSLSELCLLGNPNVRISGDSQAFETLKKLNASDASCNPSTSSLTLASVVCSDSHATPQILWGVYQFCILPLANSSDKQSSRVLTVAFSVFCALVLIIGAGVFYEMRRRRQRYEQDYASWQETASPRFRVSIADSAHLINDLRFDPEYQRYRIPTEWIVRERVIARGGFGIVYLATMTNDKGRKQKVALKRMLPERLQNVRAIEDFMEEIRFCIRLQHVNIVEFVGYSWTTLPNLCVLTEYMSQGDLWTLLDRDHDTQSIPWGSTSNSTAMLEEIRRIKQFTKIGVLVDVLKALIYLHAQDVIHRDLKAKNVMLNDLFVAKLTDFGTSREASEETMTSEIGTVAWIAPEVLKGVRYTEKADMYSFGVLLSEMDMMEVPYSNINRLLPESESHHGAELARTRIAMLVVAGELRPIFSTDCPPLILNIARRCLAYLPQDRPTAHDVYTWIQAGQIS